MIFDYVKFIQDWFKLKVLLWSKQGKVIFKQNKKRLTNRIGVLDDRDFDKVRERFIEFYSGV